MINLGLGLLILLILSICVLILGVLFPARGLFLFLGWLAPGAVYFIRTDQPAIAVTLDDGPNPTTTSAILDLLREHRAQATFFVISGRIPGHEHLMQRMVDEGHEMGNHLTEDRPSIRLSPAAFAADLANAHQALTAYGRPRWLRPGSGWYTPRMVQTCRDQGYQLALGSLFPFDTLIASSRFARWFILSRIQPGDILVLHDAGAWGEHTVLTLQHVLPELQRRGYQVVTLSALVSLATQSQEEGRPG